MKKPHYMNKIELIKRLEDIEWEDFEVKEARSEVPKNVWEAVSAFSNTAGGWIIFGVRKNGKQYEITGVCEPGKIADDFLNVLRSASKFNKRMDPLAKKYEFDGKTVLGFYIQQKHPREKPLYFNTQKNTFIRAGSGDRRATQEEIYSFYRNASFEEKDNEITDLTINDLDPETIRQYRNLFLQVNPNHRYIVLSDEDFLGKLAVLNDHKVTYGGLIVFGKEDIIQNKLPNFRIEYLEVNGISYENAKSKYDYRISSENNLFQTFFCIYERLLKKIEIPFSVRKGIRNDDPAHLQALREALVNLIIHTDYFSKSNPRIRLFTDRFEFYNPGALPKRIELILKEDFSLPRNPILAKIFRYVNFAENIGSGFNRMINGWQARYKVQPVIEGDFDYYKITFPTITNTITKTSTKLSLIQEPKEQEILEIIINNH
jgi:ATP-dependent DNA helicase RecG